MFCYLCILCLIKSVSLKNRLEINKIRLRWNSILKNTIEYSIPRERRTQLLFNVFLILHSCRLCHTVTTDLNIKQEKLILRLNVLLTLMYQENCAKISKDKCGNKKSNT